ncbi:hypothetical protein ACET3Z_019043 [Daucus carota]
MGSCEGGVAVVVKRTEVVVAVLPVAESRLAMSNLDLLLPPLDVGIFLCYDKGSENINNETKISMLKRGLGQALVPFYPLAGEVAMNSQGEPALFCNNRGVDFVHAFADIDLQHLDLYTPDASIHVNFVPIKKHGVFSIQVTETKCGGLVIGCTFDHRAADAHSINKFLVAWADITRSICPLNISDKAMVNKYTPCFRRSLLTPRKPSHHDPAIDDMYILIKNAAPPSNSPPLFHLQSRIYQISAYHIQRLQSLAGPKRTKLESFTALLWKLLAKSAKHNKKKCKLGIVVNGRNCLTDSSTTDTKISFDDYFGNVLSVPYSESTVGELKSLPLSAIANKVHACVESAANEEHFRGLVDWVEKQRPQQAMCKVYSCIPNEAEEAAVVVSSGQRFPVSQMEFGWGRPCFGSYYFPWGGYTGYVMPMPSAANDGDWIVFMHLSPSHLDFIERDAPNIFKPFVK